MTISLEWRQCIGFPDYEVSEVGDVRRVTASATRSAGWRHRGFINCDGYLEYRLLDADGIKRAATAHSLVANAFIGPAPTPEHEVAHENGSRIDCHVGNLRWDTRKGNHADLQTHGTALKGEKNGRAKLTDEQVLEIRREYRAIKQSRGERRVAELDVRFGLNRATICDIARGKSWKHLPMPTGSV